MDSGSFWNEIPGIAFAVLLASVPAVLGNRLLAGRWGRNAIRWASPILEETAKYSASVLTGSSLVAVYGGFGLVEAAWDFRGRSRYRYLAGLSAVWGHLLFGLAALGGRTWTGSHLVAFGAAAALHLLWNITVVRRP